MNDNDQIALAARLRQARLAKGWTTGDVARALELEHDHGIIMYEENGIEPSLKMLRRLAFVLEVPLEWLITGHRCTP